MNQMNTCTRCGGKFPTRTSGIAPGVTLCMSAAQCDANLARRVRTDATIILRAGVEFDRPVGPSLGDAIALNAALHLEGRNPRRTSHPAASSTWAFWRQ